MQPLLDRRDGRQWREDAAPVRAAAPSPAPAAGSAMSAPPREAARAEARLLAGLRAGDEAAFDEFAKSHLPGLYRFAAARMTRDLDLVQDLVQTALLKAIEGLDGFRGEAPLFTWLCACCRNEIASHYRRRSRRPEESDEGVGELAAREEAAEAQLLALERRELVHAALDRLPARYARALRAKYLEGAAVREIAARSHESEKTIESLLGRARAAFRVAYRHLLSGDATPDKERTTS